MVFFDLKMRLWWCLLVVLWLLKGIHGISTTESDNTGTDTADENDELPKHSFQHSDMVIKTGKSKGNVRKCVTLLIPPYIFKRKRNCVGPGKVFFACTSCESLKRYLHAQALKEIHEDGSETYTLLSAPHSSKHVCAISTTAILTKQFRRELYQEIALNPIKPLPTIYEEVRNDMCKDLSHDERVAFLQDIPTYSDVQANLYVYRKEFIPGQPKTQGEVDATSDWFLFSQLSGESMIKIDYTQDNGLRLLGFSSKECMQILARAQCISVDGTFQVSPRLWYQLFIITVEATDDVWIPTFFCLLPNKRLQTYEDFFTQLHNALELEELSLSAEICMADFELNIRKSLKKVFPRIEVKGCHFHYSQAIWRRVHLRGFKVAYSKKKNKDFATFVRMCIALPYCPLDRIEEGLSNIEKRGAALKGKFKKFAYEMVNYIRKVWLTGNYDPSSWNLYLARHASTNNHQEGYNYRLSNQKAIGRHPNIHRLSEQLRNELSKAAANAMQATVGNPNKKSSTKMKKLRRKKLALMKNLHKRRLSLSDYQIAMGCLTTSLDDRVSHIEEIPDDSLHTHTGDIDCNSTTSQNEPETIVPEKDISMELYNDHPSMSGSALRKFRREIANEFIELSLDDMSYSIPPNIAHVPTIQEHIHRELGLAWPPERLLMLSEGANLARERLDSLGYDLSPTQPITPPDGNCLFHGLLDQLQ